MAIRLSLEEDRVEETHEINVTPFIDVILVLLIIFMVAAPLVHGVDLPASTARPAPRPGKPLFLTLKTDLSLVLGEASVKREDSGAALDAAAQGDKEQRVLIGLVGMEAAPSPEVGQASSPSESKAPGVAPAEAKP